VVFCCFLIPGDSWLELKGGVIAGGDLAFLLILFWDWWFWSENMSVMRRGGFAVVYGSRNVCQCVIKGK